MLRFHTQTGGATLTAQQPENNIVRTALEALAAVLGGTQSLHTNAFDEALALPTERSAKIALRTQQVIGYETGVANVADPLGGSYYVESLTDELERLATATTSSRIDGMGGAVAAIEAGLLPGRDPRGGVPDPAGRSRTGERVIVGRQPVPDAEERAGRAAAASATTRCARQIERLRRAARLARRRRRRRGAGEPSSATARGTANLLPPMKEALRARAHARRGLRCPARASSASTGPRSDAEVSMLVRSAR